MPFYHYRCRKCGQEQEVEQRITDAPLTFCNRTLPQGTTQGPISGPCMGELYRVVQPIAVQFKGPGFHCVDYRTRK